jgi:formate dehydrogenase subunit gamma
MAAKTGPTSFRPRVWRLPDGTLLFIRFTFGQQMQHWILLLAGASLALTGLAQKYSDTAWASFTLKLLGGLETTQVVHHFFSLCLIALALYHVLNGVYTRFVNNQPWKLGLSRRDLHNATQAVKYDLGVAKDRPRFDRYTIGEKIVYWMTFLSAAILIGTGLIMLFPTRTTEVVSGAVIPVARAVHGGQALVAVIFIVIVHLYLTVVRTRNGSIFTGQMSESQMRRDHPLEYEALVAALSPTAGETLEDDPTTPAASEPQSQGR